MADERRSPLLFLIVPPPLAAPVIAALRRGAASSPVLSVSSCISSCPSWFRGSVMNRRRLRPPATTCHRLQADASPDGRRNDPQLRHQPIELCRKHRLRAVTQRVIRIAVYFDDKPVGAGRYRRPGHRRNHVATPRPVARIGHNRQVTELLDDRNRRNVERVPSGGLEGANTALAEDDVVVA